MAPRVEMSEKTELPTHQRIRKAREDGQVAHSKDFTQTALVVALFGYMLANAQTLIEGFGEMMLMPTGVMGMEFDMAANALATGLLRKGLELLAPFLGIVIILGLLIEFTQTGVNISFKALKPSGKKLDVGANLKNMFSVKNLFEFVKSNIKIALLSIVVYGVLRSSLPALMTVPYGGLDAVGSAAGAMLMTMMVHVSLGYALVALADMIWQRHQYVKQLMMTKDEVKQEYKDNEGDPHIKHKRRELHKELLEDGEAANVKHASAVVTNPTHLAVALVYEKDLTPLPVVVAKGEGAHAKRIVKVARENGVPVLQDIPLARALMATAPLKQYIPSELIEPVAELLRLVRDMKEKEDGS
jgi:type III secretion protein U